jgi:uncharacterized protein HemX
MNLDIRTDDSLGDPQSSQSSVSEEDRSVSKSTTSERGDSEDDAAEVIEKPLAEQETRAVNRSKLLIYMALILAAALGTTAYVYTSREEETVFESEVSQVRMKSC